MSFDPSVNAQPSGDDNDFLAEIENDDDDDYDISVDTKNDKDSLGVTTSKHIPQLSTYSWDNLSISELCEYLSWDCPLNDENHIALIARTIMSYLGQSIILSSLTIRNHFEKLNYNTGCISNNGVFYIHHSGDSLPNYQISKRYLDIGLSRFPMYIEKIYSQSIEVLKQKSLDNICGLNVLTAMPHNNSNSNSNNNNNNNNDSNKQENTKLKTNASSSSSNSSNSSNSSDNSNENESDSEDKEEDDSSDNEQTVDTTTQLIKYANYQLNKSKIAKARIQREKREKKELQERIAQQKKDKNNKNKGKKEQGSTTNTNAKTNENNKNNKMTKEEKLIGNLGSALDFEDEKMDNEKRLSKKLDTWHKIVTNQVSLPQVDGKLTRLYSVEKETFIFFYSGLTLFCYNNDTCAAIQSTKIPIVDVWRQGKTLYLLRGPIEAAISGKDTKFEQLQKKKQMRRYGKGHHIRSLTPKPQKARKSPRSRGRDGDHASSTNKNKKNKKNGNNNDDEKYDDLSELGDISALGKVPNKMGRQSSKSVDFGDTRKTKKDTFLFVPSAMDKTKNKDSNMIFNMDGIRVTQCQLFQITLKEKLITSSANEIEKEINSIQDDYSKDVNDTPKLRSNKSSNVPPRSPKSPYGGASPRKSKNAESPAERKVIASVNVKKLFEFPAQFINENCCYYNEISKTLFVAYNDVQNKKVELRIIRKQTIEKKSKKKKNEENDSGKDTTNDEKSNEKDKENENDKNDNNNDASDNGKVSPKKSKKILQKPKKKVLSTPLVATLQYPKNIELLFKNCRCHYLFYHRLSSSIILLLKNPTLQEKVEKMVNYRNQNKNANNNEKVQKLVKKMEIQSKLFENLFKNGGNLGRILAKIRINFDTLEIESMKCGLINIPENSCRIVAYDDSRAAVIIDTKQVNSVDFEKIRNNYEEIRNEVTACESDKPNTDYGKKAKPQKYSWSHRLRTSYSNNSSSKHYSYFASSWADNRRSERNYRVLRINDMVNKWKNVY